MKRLKNVHPGEVLLEDFLIPLGISASEFAEKVEISQVRLMEILKGDRRITTGTAMRFSKYFGNSTEFWLGLQINFDSEKKKK